MRRLQGTEAAASAVSAAGAVRRVGGRATEVGGGDPKHAYRKNKRPFCLGPVMVCRQTPATPPSNRPEFTLNAIRID